MAARPDPCVALEAWRTFRFALAGQGRGLLAGLATALALTFLELARPWPLKFVFDAVLPRPGPEAAWLLAGAAGAVAGISLLLGFLQVRLTVTVARVGRTVAQRIRRRLFEHLHRLAFPFHQSARTGDLLVRLMGDVNLVRDLLFASWLTLLGRGTLFVGITAVMLALDPLTAGLAFLPIPFLLVWLGRCSQQLSAATRKQRRREGDAAAMAAESLHQIRLVKAYAAEEVTTERFARRSRRGERAGLKAARIGAGMARATEVLTGAGLGLVLFVGARRVLGGALTPGELLVCLSYTRALYKPLRALAKEGSRLGKATACAARVLEILRLAPEPAAVGLPAPPFRGEIEARNLRFRYPGGVAALQGLSFRLPAGSLVLVAGPNGAGKSTLVALLLRLYLPDAGELRIDGRNVQDFQLASYRRRFAYVPQGVQLFAASLRENILYGAPDADEEAVRRAVRVCLLEDVVARLPEGLATPVGENGESLSGGEARRVMLARAALRDARVLLLDEPLAGLDPAARGTVARAVRRLARGRTTLVVSHGDVDTLAPDLVLELREGRVAGLRPAAGRGA